MTDHQLTDLLERAAERTDVGPPPLDGMLRGVRRRRRRRAVLAGAGLTVAAVAAAIAVPVVTSPHDGTPATPTITRPTRSSGVDPEIDLEGHWVVSALVRRSGRPAPTSYGGTRFHLVFRHGMVHAFDGCNELSGGYAVHDDRFRLKQDVTQTLVGCVPGPAPFFERLQDVRSVARDQGGTYLEDAAGNVVIALWHR